MARGSAYTRSKKRSYKGRSKKRSSKKRGTRKPRSLFKGEKSTTFTLTRTYELQSSKAGGATGAAISVPNQHATSKGGVLSPVWAIGNLAIAAPFTGTEAADANGIAAMKLDKKKRTFIGLESLKSVFQLYKVLKHEIYLIPMCGDENSNNNPLEEHFSSFAVDISSASTKVSSALQIQNYGLVSNSKIHAPSNERMPYLVKRFYPSGSSTKDNTWMNLEAGTASDPPELNYVEGVQNGGKTFGFWKLYSDGLTPSVAYYRCIEKMTVAVAQRKTGGLYSIAQGGTVT